MIGIIIATAGRPQLIQPLLACLARQTRRPDWIVLAPARPGDLPDGAEVTAAAEGCEVIVVPCVVGLASQRNRGLDWLLNNTEMFESEENIAVFFDDDFIARSDWLESATQVFEQHRDVVGLTGVLLGDGVKGAGLNHADADRLLSRQPHKPVAPESLRTATLYGCNMAIRASAARVNRFDEMLPLYAWQEDFDYSQRIASGGRVVQTPTAVGVHLGVKGGRVSGRRFGYSQIANPYYLLAKGTMGPLKALRLVGGNLTSNLMKLLFPEPHIDRMGRLKGNVLGFRDLLTGRLDPRRIMQL